MIAVRVNGAAAATPLTLRERPGVEVWNVSGTPCALMVRLTEAVAPLLSVAVRVISIDDGYSWSGAANEPDATPFTVKNGGWVWQFDGQWMSAALQDSPDAGTVPSWASVAEP